MCILLATTESEDYPFILLSNRDEYFRRPTENARFRIINNKKVLSPADMGREEHGTWIGVNKEGRLAVLVNYREMDVSVISDVSRGILPLDYLTSDYEDDDEWYNNLETSLAKRVEGDVPSVPLKRVGGFSLLYGKLRLNANNKIEKLNIISNRGDKGTVFDTKASEGQKGYHSSETTIGLSNSLFYEPWEKVSLGNKLLAGVVKSSKNSSQAELVEELFRVLSVDTFDKSYNDKPMIDKLMGLRSTIFVPPLETNYEESKMNPVMGKYYGTRTQTIIMLDKTGVLHYYEKDLHYTDDLSEQVPKTQYFSFQIQQ